MTDKSGVAFCPSDSGVPVSLVAMASFSRSGSCCRRIIVVTSEFELEMAGTAGSGADCYDESNSQDCSDSSI